MKKTLQTIFSFKNQNEHIILTILGIKIKFRKEKSKTNNISFQNNLLLRHIQLLSSVSRLHPKTFEQYKNIYNGKDVVLIATGPSLKYFEPIKNGIYTGVNSAFLFNKIKLDYLFMEDYSAVKSYIEDVKDYNCIKFYGINNGSAIKQFNSDPLDNWMIPESIAIRHGANRFYSESPWLTGCIPCANYKPAFAYDITTEPLYCYGTICFPAMQFLLYTNPEKIYIAGCDCSSNGYFNGKPQTSAMQIEYVIAHWKKLKEFVKDYYPETEIISVNPVGLTGVFKDLYTKSFLKDHPEIDSNNVEVMLN